MAAPRCSWRLVWAKAFADDPRTYGLHERDVIHEIPLRHVQRELAVGRTFLKHFEVVHHREEFAGQGGRADCGGAAAPRLYTGLLVCEASEPR